jgi:hypothetical protein
MSLTLKNCNTFPKETIYQKVLWIKEDCKEEFGSPKKL